MFDVPFADMHTSRDFAGYGSFSLDNRQGSGTDTLNRGDVTFTGLNRGDVTFTFHLDGDGKVEVRLPR